MEPTVVLEDIFHRSPHLLHQISTDRSQRLENCGCFFFEFLFVFFFFVHLKTVGGLLGVRQKKIPFRKGLKTMRICQWLCQIKQKSDVI